jgi:hypothetical protein
VTGRNVFLGQPAATQDLRGSKLIERMQANPLVIFRKRVVLGETLVANDARNRLRFRHALLLHQKLQRAITPASLGPVAELRAIERKASQFRLAPDFTLFSHATRVFGGFLPYGSGRREKRPLLV